MGNDIVKKDNVEFLAKREVDRGDPQALTALDLAPKSLRDVRDMAVMIAESGLGPEAWRNPNAGVVMLITAMEMGLTIGQAWRGMYAVKGMPAMGSGLVLAMIRSHKECEYFRIVEASKERATCKTKRRSEPEADTVTYTIQQAKDAGLLVKDNWKNHPEDMLVSKAVLRLARRVYQDILYGFASREELEDEVAATTSVSQIVDSVETPPQQPQLPAASPPRAPQPPPTPEATRKKERSSSKRTEVRSDKPDEPRQPPAAPAAPTPPASTPGVKMEAEPQVQLDRKHTSAPEPQPILPAAPAPAAPVDLGQMPEWERKMRSARTIEELDEAAASASLDFNAPDDVCDRIYNETLNSILGK